MAEKRKKVRNTEDGAEDRLSDLADEVLHIILFVLGAKEAVQTSVLSKRWKNIWTYAPDLDFDNRSFRRVADFKKFVYAFMDAPRIRNGDGDVTHHYNVRKFRLYRNRGNGDKEFTKKIIDFAISHSVEHLDMYLKQPGLFPDSLFQSQSLETLQLYGFHLPGSLTFTMVTVGTHILH